MKDVKNYGQDLQHSAYVMQANKAHKRNALLLNVAGSLIGALSLYLMIVVMFEGALWILN